MHELSIAVNLAEIINDTVPENDLPFIDIIKIDVGLLSNVFPDSLLFSFNSVKEKTHFNSAKLIINKVPLSVKCRNCASISTGDDFIFLCNTCSSADIEVIGGNELRLSEITLRTNSGKK
jgi:hydrogenase nickel incorporation protein HypA/HybF